MKLFAYGIPALNGSGTTEITPPAGIPSGSEFTVGRIATSFLSVAIVFGVLLSIIYLTYGGFLYMQSRGAKEQLDKARRVMLYAIIGLIVMASSLVIVSLVTGALGVNTSVGGIPTR
jgi:hypothetical protein